jgi:hypothetical protein
MPAYFIFRRITTNFVIQKLIINYSPLTNMIQSPPSVKPDIRAVKMIDDLHTGHA